MYIADQLKKTVELQPNSVITSFEGRVTTYEQFYQQAESLASHLQELGYQKEDILALALPNSDYFLVCYFACQIGGFSVLPINIKLTSREIEYILSHSQAKGLVYDKSVESTIQAIIPSLPNLKDIFTTNVESSSNRLENILLETGKKIGKVARADNDTAVIFYTSGTTGRPKGVMLTNRNVISIAQMWSESMDMVKHDRTHIVAPLYHCAASHVLSIPTIYAGGALVIEEGFSPEQTMKTMEEEDVTIFFGVPAMYNIMLNTNRLQEAQLPNLRLLTYGAAPMPYELVKKVKEIFPNVKVQNLYGQTENSPGATTLKDHYALTKIGSVGEPLPNCLVRIVGENGEQLQTGEVGEIIVKGPHVMKGYLKNEEATREAIKDGWLYSGDLGRLDDDGLLYIVDRKKDMIIRGGENIYPVELEEVLYEIPEILEAAVIGVPHEVYGEVPKAFVVKKEGMELDEERVLDYCRQKLAKYKVPYEVEFLEQLPRNASGKVLKVSLRSKENASL